MAGGGFMQTIMSQQTVHSPYLWGNAALMEAMSVCLSFSLSFLSVTHTSLLLLFIGLPPPPPSAVLRS